MSVRKEFCNFIIMLLRRPSPEDAPNAGGKSRHDLCRLLRRFSLTIDDFRIATPELAVVVDLRKVEVLEGQGRKC